MVWFWPSKLPVNRVAVAPLLLSPIGFQPFPPLAVALARLA